MSDEEPRYGRQEPTFSVIGDYHHTDGPRCVSLFEQYGFEFMPWQKSQLDLYCARNADGSFAATSIGNSTPRQNGKSFPARLYAVWASLVEGRNVLYSAHNGYTVTDFFRSLRELFEDTDRYPDFAKYLDYSYKQPGREMLKFTTGNFIRFQTRTNAVSRGGTVGVIIIDEAQELTNDQAASLIPAASAASAEKKLVVADPQFIYLGTPNYPSCQGTEFKRMHAKAHSEDPGSTWWTEWAVDSLPDSNNNRELWYLTNPGLGYRSSLKAFQDEADHLAPDTFARERLGWWRPDDGGYIHAIDGAAWERLATDNPPTGGRVAYGVKFAPDGSHASICAAVDEEGFPLHVEWLETYELTHGCSKLDSFLASRVDDACCFLADGKGSADNLADRMRAQGAPRAYCRVARTSDVVRASANLCDLIRSGGITHYAQQPLTESAVLASRRQIGSKEGGGFGFGAPEGVDSTPIEAAALAVLAVQTTKRNPNDKQRVMSW